jgi:hypothetical protein
VANIIFSEGSGVNDSVFGKSQYPIRMMLERRGEAFEQEDLTKVLFKQEKSKHWAEKYTSMTEMDGFDDVGEDGAYPQDGFQEGFSKVIENHTWKNSFAISQEMVEDAKISEFKSRPEKFIKSYYRTRRLFAISLYAAAICGNTTLKFRGKNYDAKTSDDKALFSTNHPSKIKSSFTQSNRFSNALTADGLGAVETAHQNLKDDNGNLLDCAPTTIVIPNDYATKDALFQAVGSDHYPLDSDKSYNYQFGRWNIIVEPYLFELIKKQNPALITGGSKPWMLIDTNYLDTYGAAVWQDRIPLTVKSSIDENNDANRWRGRARFAAGFVDWRFATLGGIVGATDAAA